MLLKYFNVVNNVKELLERGQFILDIFDQADSSVIYDFIKDVCIVLRQQSQ